MGSWEWIENILAHRSRRPPWVATHLTATRRPCHFAFRQPSSAVLFKWDVVVNKNKNKSEQVKDTLARNKV